MRTVFTARNSQSDAHISQALTNVFYVVVEYDVVGVQQ